MNKPFSPSEFLARIFNLIERYEVRKSIQHETVIEEEIVPLVPSTEKTETPTIPPNSKIVKEEILEEIKSKNEVSEENSWLKNVEKIMRDELENSKFKLSGPYHHLP